MLDYFLKVNVKIHWPKIFYFDLKVKIFKNEQLEYYLYCF